MTSSVWSLLSVSEGEGTGRRETLTIAICLCAQLLSRVWLFCSPTDCSPIGCSVHGILQARILEWVVMPFPRGSSRPRDQTQVSCVVGRCFTIWATREVPRVGSNSCPLSWWCHTAISCSFTPFCFCLQSCPASGSFPIGQLLEAGGQSTGASASASVLPMNIQVWYLKF